MSLRDERTTPADVTLALSGMAAGILTKRKAAKQSVRDAAAEAGVPFSSLSRAERGIGEPSVPVFMAILRWLDLPGWGECEFSLRNVGQGCPCGCPVVEDMCCCDEPCPCSPCGYCDAPASGSAE